jgi:hypothetical protein
MDQITNESVSSRNYGDYNLMDPLPGQKLTDKIEGLNIIGVIN